MISDLAFILVSYLLGSVSAAVVVCRVLGKGDPRETGSGNPGATNVLRAHGKGPAAATLIGDIGKGVVPVLLARWAELGPLVIGGCACAAFLGHLFPVFFGFRGGKGVATFVGVLLAIISGSFTCQRPFSEVFTVSLFDPMLTVTISPAAAQPQIRSGICCCSTM